MQNTRTPALVNVAAVAINVVADLVLFFGADLGVARPRAGSRDLLRVRLGRAAPADPPDGCEGSTARGCSGQSAGRCSPAPRPRRTAWLVARWLGTTLGTDTLTEQSLQVFTRDRRGSRRIRGGVDSHADRGGRRRSPAPRREVAAMRCVRTDERGLIGKIILIWLVILGLVVVALDRRWSSIVLARLADQRSGTGHGVRGRGSLLRDREAAPGASEPRRDHRGGG